MEPKHGKQPIAVAGARGGLLPPGNQQLSPRRRATNPHSRTDKAAALPVGGAWAGGGASRIGEANDGGLLGGGGDVWAVASAALGHQLPAAAYTSRAGTRQGRSGMLAASALRGW